MTARARQSYPCVVIAAYERAGFYAYHVAEHHLTDLGMAPSPSVFVAAVKLFGAKLD